MTARPTAKSPPAAWRVLAAPVNCAGAEVVVVDEVVVERAATGLEETTGEVMLDVVLVDTTVVEVAVWVVDTVVEEVAVVLVDVVEVAVVVFEEVVVGAESVTGGTPLVWKPAGRVRLC